MADRHEWFVKLLDEMKAIHAAKNADYASEADSLSNFRMCEAMGIPAWKGSLVRMGDKYARLCSFAAKGVLSVKEESAKDTLMDLAVYSLITLKLMQEASGGAETPAAKNTDHRKNHWAASSRDE